MFVTDLRNKRTIIWSRRVLSPPHSSDIGVNDDDDDVDEDEDDDDDGDPLRQDS